MICTSYVANLCLGRFLFGAYFLCPFFWLVLSDAEELMASCQDLLFISLSKYSNLSLFLHELECRNTLFRYLG